MSEDDTVDAACTLLAQLRGLWYARMGSIRQNTRNADFTWSVLQFAHDGILQTDLDMLLRPLVDLHRALVTQREQHTRCLTDLRVSTGPGSHPCHVRLFIHTHVENSNARCAGPEDPLWHRGGSRDRCRPERT